MVKKLEENGVELQVYKRYVDDINVPDYDCFPGWSKI